MSEPLNSLARATIATDPASPHYGHPVFAWGEGEWCCVRCDFDRALDILEAMGDRLRVQSDLLLRVASDLQTTVTALLKAYDR
jgi:hypothetical protein